MARVAASADGEVAGGGSDGTGSGGGGGKGGNLGGEGVPTVRVETAVAVATARMGTRLTAATERMEAAMARAEAAMAQVAAAADGKVAAAATARLCGGDGEGGGGDGEGGGGVERGGRQGRLARRGRRPPQPPCCAGSRASKPGHVGSRRDDEGGASRALAMCGLLRARVGRGGGQATADSTVANFCTLNVAEHRAAGNVSCHSCKQAADARCTQLRNTAHWRCRGKNCNRAGGRWSLSAHTVRDANKRACRCTRLFLKSVKVYFWSLSDRSGSLEIAEQSSRSEMISD